MKKVIVIEGKAFIASEIEVNPASQQEGKFLKVYNSDLTKMVIALKTRMQHCMEAFESAVEKNLIDNQWEQRNAQKEVRYSFGWTDEFGYRKHFSTLAYEAMESAIAKLDEMYLPEAEAFQNVFNVDTFSALELEQLLKAICDTELSQLKPAFIEMLACRCMHFGA